MALLKQRQLIFRLGIVALFAAILLSILYFTVRPDQPYYQGKSLSAWAADAMATDEDGTTDSPATKLRNAKGNEAIRQIGVKALPTALELCRANDSKFRDKLVRASADLSGKLHFDVHIRSDYEKHWEGVAIFTALGPVAKPAIPSLIEIMQSHNPSLNDTAMLALHGIGSESIGPLTDALANGNRLGRVNIAQYFGYYFGRQASNAVPILLRYIESDDSQLRNAAAESPSNIPDDPVKVVPALAKFIQTEMNASIVRNHVIQRLGYMGTNARPAVPVLLELVNSNRDSRAYNALCQIAPEVAEHSIMGVAPTNVESAVK